MTTDKKQITRNRVSLSCQTCRRRKVKCDKSHPRCGACEKANEECIYGEADKQNSSTAEQQAIDEDVGSTRKRRAEDDPEDLGRDAERTPTSTLRMIEQKLSQLSSLMHDINRLTPVSNENSPDNGQTRSSTWSDNLSTYHHPHGDLMNSLNESHSATVNNSSGDVPWAGVLGKLDQLNFLLCSNMKARPTSTGIPDSHGSLNAARSVDSFTAQQSPQPLEIRSRPLAPASSTDIDALMADVSEADMIAPTAEESNALFRSWLWSTYPICPLISPKLVLQKYEAFNYWYRYGMDRGEPNPDSSFMPFLTLIWYTGHANLSHRGQEKWFPWAKGNPLWIKRLQARLTKLLEPMKTEATPSIWMLAASIICQHLAIGGQDIIVNSMQNTLNIRTAQSLGLHSERTFKSLTESEAETRRRIWWEVITMDTSLSTVSGMPVVLDECYTDTRMISELKESCLGTKDAIDYEEHLKEPDEQPDRPDDPANWQATSLVSVYHLVARARHELTRATKKMLKANMSAQPMSVDELKEMRKSLASVTKEVHKIINRIPTRGVPEHDFMPETGVGAADFDYLESMGSPISEQEISHFLRENSDQHGLGGVAMHHRTATIAFHKWARIALSMMIERLDCVSYAPFLKNSKSRLWAVARSCALRGCHGFMRKYLCLAEDPELRRFRWVWSSTFHPMHATIILLIDLHDRPHSDEAPRSRALIDKMFLLASPESGLLEFGNWPKTALPLREGGEEAWTMLKKLRHKAWYKAGLDPDVLWTEEDQMSVGVGKPLNENDLFIRSLREDIIHSHKQRQSRTTGGIPCDPLNYRLVNSPARLAAAKEYLHPSEIGPGERVTGPITRDVADLDAPESLPVLLLRARQDQPLMPFPLSANSALFRKVQDNHTRTNSQPTPQQASQNGDNTEIYHIGELIRKIRQTKPQNPGGTSNETTTPTPQDISALWTPMSPPNDTNCDYPCNFRQTQGAITAAYEDLVEKHSTPGMLPIRDPNTNANPNVEQQKFVGFFSYPPTISLPVASNASNDTNSAVLRNQSRETEEGLSMAASIPPTMHNLGYTRSKKQVSIKYPFAQGFESNGAQPMSASTAAAAPSVPVLNGTAAGDGRAVVTDFSAGLGADPSADIDFDWDRWDELFGQFAGFEDMLAEMGHDED